MALAALWPLVARAMEQRTTTTDPIPTPIATIALTATDTPLLTIQEEIALAFPDAPVMVRIAQAESQFDPNAKNASSTATGLFQILKSTWEIAGCTGTITDAADNIACARKLYDADGTVPWASSESRWQ